MGAGWFACHHCRAAAQREALQRRARLERLAVGENREERRAGPRSCGVRFVARVVIRYFHANHRLIHLVDRHDRGMQIEGERREGGVRAGA